eukprot:PITA_04446
MLKKDSELKWIEEAVKYFNLVKLILSLAPTLINPDYTQDFILFSFAFEHTLAAVLMQKRDGVERPIAFFNRIIRDRALNYNIIEKQALALIKALKDFRVYILNSHILAYVPNAAVKDVLVQTEPEGRRVKWIAALLEYDVEIKTTKLIKGQGLAKLMAETNLHVLDINLIAALSDEDEENSALQAAKFCIIKSALYWKDPGGILLNCLVEEEAKTTIEDFHKGDCGGHLFWKTIANKILRAGFYWPYLFYDVYKTVKSCHECQIFQGNQKLQSLPLKPIEISAPFQQWGMDFIGKVHSASSGQHRWILTATDYFTKWIEAIPTRKATNSIGAFDRLPSTRKWVGRIFKQISSEDHQEIVGNQQEELAQKLVNALWADRVSQKKSIGMSPFELVYGTDVVFPTSLSVPVAKLLQEASDEEDPMQRQISQMIHLQQTRDEVLQNSLKLQERIKKIYERKLKSDDFQIDDVVLRWDARNEDKGKHGKFDNLWKGPYKIAAYRGPNAFLLKEMNGDECLGGSVNRRLLKSYYA